MKRLLTIVMILSAASGCTSMRKIEKIRSREVTVNLATTPKPESSPYEVPIDTPVGDTLIVKGADGKDIFILKAVRDERTGEMVANDVLEAACVTATFRNVAERDGKVNLEFRISVPEEMLDSKWQIRFVPKLLLPSGERELEKLIITGSGYRKEQLLGYQRYNRFLESIISDSTAFIDKMMLDRFIERYLPELYRFKKDSTIVSEETFASYFGVTAKEAITHYTNHLSIKKNEARKARKDEVFRKFVKVPILKEGIRLDTIISRADGKFIYDYRQEVMTSPGMKKVAIAITGGLWEGSRQLYSIPVDDSITFYISTLSTLVERRERFLTEIIARRVAVNNSYSVKFRLGSSTVEESLDSNAEELERIKDNILSVMEEQAFDLDSIVISATSSPEGPFQLNRRLSAARSENIVRHIRKGLASAGDSIRLVSRSLPEDWQTLTELVQNGERFDPEQKVLFAKRMEIAEPDRRENTMRGDSYYGLLKDEVYPQLRKVKLDFFMHRKGMVKDTICTTIPDTTYRAGLKALENGDYLKAASLLHGYRDYNTALAYCSLNRNYTALDILDGIEITPKANYLLAIIHARLGDEQKAVQNYLLACNANSSFLHRGNLDPEISSLIKKYNLNGFQ